MRLWPTTLLAVVGAGLAAIAGHQRWASIKFGTLTGHAANPALAVTAPAADAPTVTAVALVVLATWGVLLVTRGRFRFAMAVLAALAALGLLAAWVGALATVRHTVASAYGPSIPAAAVEFSAWPFAAAVGTLAALVAGIAAVRRIGSWPEMGRKYDAPAGGTAPVVPLEEQSALDVWKAMDEGRDPTADGSE